MSSDKTKVNKPSKHSPSVSHEQALIRELAADPAYAAAYLKAALEESDEPRVLLAALRQLAEASGGMAKVAQAAGLERPSLYRALSLRGNPRLSTLAAVAKAIGLKLTVEAIRPSRKRVARTGVTSKA